MPCAVAVQAQARARAGEGMTGGGPDPAAALRLLLRFDRLDEAARLALAFLDVWDLQVPLPPSLGHASQGLRGQTPERRAAAP